MSCRTKAPKIMTILTTTIWRTIRYRPPFGSSTGSYAMNSFQLTSRLLYPLLTAFRHVACLATNLLRDATTFVSLSRQVRNWVWRPKHAEVLISRLPQSGIFLPEPWALPGYSWLLSMRNCWMYVMRRDNRRASDCVAPSPLCIPPNIHLRRVSPAAYSVRSARIFAADFLKAAFRTLPLPLATLRRYLPGTGLPL